MDDIIITNVRRLAARMLHGQFLLGIVVIGSAAYREYFRGDSDIDVIAVFSDTEKEFSDIIVRERIEVEGASRLLEAKFFGASSFHEYVLTCDVAQSFAFVRGYYLLDTADDQLPNLINLALARYYSDAARLFSDMHKIGQDKHLEDAKFMMTDARNALFAPRVEDRHLLFHLRLGEFIKEFLSLLWIGTILQKSLPTDVVAVSANCIILQEVGLYRVFRAVRGARIIDSSKYAVPTQIAGACDRIENSLSDKNNIPIVMANIFDDYFGRKLFV